MLFIHTARGKAQAQMGIRGAVTSPRLGGGPGDQLIAQIRISLLALAV